MLRSRPSDVLNVGDYRTRLRFEQRINWSACSRSWMLGRHMAASAKWAVVAVDLDGTLIHGTTASLHLAEWIGHRAVVEELERRFAAGEILSSDVADGDAPHYEG